MNTPTTRTDDGGRYCSHQRRERWIKQPNNTMNTPTTRTDERKASFALDTIRQLESELAAVTEQLTVAREELNTAREDQAYMNKDLNIVTEQRDEIARAIIRFNSGTCCLPYLVDLALQSLNQPTQ